MDAVILNQITVTALNQIKVNDGDVIPIMRFNDVGYYGFGEAYFSWIKVDAVKAWKRHLSMTLNLIVPVGFVRFVFCPSSASETFRIEDIGESRYVRLTVPPGIWFGFKNLSSSPSLILNIANIPHDPGEVKRLNLQEINYEWKN